MVTTRIPALKRYAVIVAGPLDAVRAAVAEHTGAARPIARASVNGYGGVHTRVYAEPQQLEAWFAVSHQRQPGALLWYHGPVS